MDNGKFLTQKRKIAAWDEAIGGGDCGTSCREEIPKADPPLVVCACVCVCVCVWFFDVNDNKLFSL